MASDRIPCIIPFCRRTHPPADFDEWICSKHWAVTDRRYRRVYARIRRKLRRSDDIGLDRRAWRIWTRLKMQVCQRSF